MLVRSPNNSRPGFVSSHYFLLAFALLTISSSICAQRRLPSAEKVVENFIKASGGKKAVAAIRNATYEFVIQLNNTPIGTARVVRKLPASERWEMKFGNGQLISATSASSAWESGLDGRLRTLTGGESANAKLHAVLDATRLLNFRKANVLARVVAADETTYTVEFSTRSGARLRYYFEIKSGLLTRISDETKHTSTSFEDYRTENGILESHRQRIGTEGSGELVFLLQNVKYNSDVLDHVFDPPTVSPSLDVVALLKEIGRNQDEIERRVSDYSFLQKETDREITSKGELKKETVRVYEVFPLSNREPVQKLISENGVVLTGERAAKEDKRVQEEFAKADRDKDKDEKEVERRRVQREQKNRKEGRNENDDPEISQFLRVCEFVSPRHEQLGGRDTIVFDFRPRPGFRPGNREESLIAKLVGAMWIDPVDKQVIRLEARLAEGFKMAGGLLVSLKPGAALVMEQTRMVEGVWLPRLAQINLSVKVLLFGGGDFNKTIEWSDYRHFSGDVKDYKIEAPKPVPQYE